MILYFVVALIIFLIAGVIATIIFIKSRTDEDDEAEIILGLFLMDLIASIAWPLSISILILGGIFWGYTDW